MNQYRVYVTPGKSINIVQVTGEFGRIHFQMDIDAFLRSDIPVLEEGVPIDEYRAALETALREHGGTFGTVQGTIHLHLRNNKTHVFISPSGNVSV
jgi:hypothetical protein